MVRDLGRARIRVVLGVDRAPPQPVKPRRTDGWSTFDDALADDAVDAVVLCTPHRLHAEQIVAAAAAGKHVFCEKPFATTGAEARAAPGGGRGGRGPARDRARAPLRAGHPASCGTACRSGELGRTARLRGQLQPGQVPRPAARQLAALGAAAPAGPLSATGIHLVDLAITVLGRPVEVWARLATMATSFANGDTLTTTIGFEPAPRRPSPRSSPRPSWAGSRDGVAGLDRDPRPQPPRGPAGWDVPRRAARRRAGEPVLPPVPGRAGEPRVLRPARARARRSTRSRSRTCTPTCARSRRSAAPPPAVGVEDVLVTARSGTAHR